MTSAIPLPPRNGLLTQGQYLPRIRTRDRQRAAELVALVEMGLQPLDAWRRILLGPLGFPQTRGRPKDDGYVAASLAQHCRTMCPAEMERVQALAGTTLRQAAIEGATLVRNLVRGEFGEGKVRVRGMDENKTEVVTIDAAAAAVQLQAVKLAFQATNVIDSTKKPTQVNVQSNVVISLADKLRAAATESRARPD